MNCSIRCDAIGCDGNGNECQRNMGRRRKTSIWIVKDSFRSIPFGFCAQHRFEFGENGKLLFLSSLKSRPEKFSSNNWFQYSRIHDPADEALHIIPATNKLCILCRINLNEWICSLRSSRARYSRPSAFYSMMRFSRNSICVVCAYSK